MCVCVCAFRKKGHAYAYVRVLRLEGLSESCLADLYRRHSIPSCTVDALTSVFSHPEEIAWLPCAIPISSATGSHSR